MTWLCLIATVLSIHAPPLEPAMLLPNRFAIPVRTDQNFNPAHLEIGAPVSVIISHDLRWNDCLVFREGTPVSAFISEARGPGVVGRPSLIVLEIKSTVAADGTVVPLSGLIRAEGEDRMMESIAAAAGVCCLGIFIPGGHQSIGKGVGTVALTTTEIEIRCIGQ